MIQKTNSHAAKSATSRARRNLGFVLRVDVESAGTPRMVFEMPWISNAGVTRMVRISSEPSVSRSASSRAAGLRVLLISHSSNSTNTADSPMLVEKTSDAILDAEGCRSCSRKLLDG